MTILVLSGPNLNLLGKRDPKHYGSVTLDRIHARVKEYARKRGVRVECFQTNHEGEMIDYIQEHASDGIVLNPGAWTHSSYALHDALVDAGVPVVEVHCSEVENREEWRRHSVIKPAAIHRITGKRDKSYDEGVEYLTRYLQP